MAGSGRTRGRRKTGDPRREERRAERGRGRESEREEEEGSARWGREKAREKREGRKRDVSGVGDEGERGESVAARGRVGGLLA